jgi:plasmid stabilization system protein ParE
LRVRFLTPAEREYLTDLQYYTAQAVELGGAFLDDIDHAVALLSEHPHIGAPFDGDVRRLLLRRFHHSLLYVVEADEVVVLAVQHQSRHPDSWRKNL